MTILIIVSILLITKKLRFIKNSHFTWGKIIKLEESSPKDSDIWQRFVIEYIDQSTHEIYEIERSNQFGDNEEQLKKEIQEYHESGRKLLGKRVPVLYKTGKPNKTLVFLEKAE